MASVSINVLGKGKSKAAYRLRFVDPRTGVEKKIRLPKMVNRRKNADVICSKVSSLVSSIAAGDKPTPEVARWIRGISDELHQRLATAGLFPPRVRLDFGSFTEGYLADHLKQTGASSEMNLNRTRDLLGAFLGMESDVRDVTTEKAKDFRLWLMDGKRNGNQSYAEPTVAGHIKRAKQFFRAATKSGVIQSNPFDDVAVGSQVNDDRSVYVPAETVDKVINASHCAEMRLLIALSRYGGLRVPSEATRMLWTDIDFEKNEMIIRGKAGNDGKVKRRLSPVFPQLKPYLIDLFDPENTHVINRYRTTNPRTQMMRLIKRADVDQWERLFHNMRGSWETDLYEGGFDIHAVAKWLGHTPEIALKHYLKVTGKQREKAQNFEIQSPAVVSGVVSEMPQVAATGGNGQELICVSPGVYVNPGEFASNQHTREDSNLQPSVPKTDALSN